MNANGIINMITRMIFRKVMNKGVNAGIDKAFGKGKKPQDMTPEERQQARQGKQNARRAGRM